MSRTTAPTRTCHVHTPVAEAVCESCGLPLAVLVTVTLAVAVGVGADRVAEAFGVLVGMALSDNVLVKPLLRVSVEVSESVAVFVAVEDMGDSVPLQDKDEGLTCVGVLVWLARDVDGVRDVDSVREWVRVKDLVGFGELVAVGDVEMDAVGVTVL